MEKKPGGFPYFPSPATSKPAKKAEQGKPEASPQSEPTISGNIPTWPNKKISADEVAYVKGEWLDHSKFIDYDELAKVTAKAAEAYSLSGPEAALKILKDGLIHQKSMGTKVGLSPNPCKEILKDPYLFDSNGKAVYLDEETKALHYLDDALKPVPIPASSIMKKEVGNGYPAAMMIGVIENFKVTEHLKEMLDQWKKKGEIFLLPHTPIHFVSGKQVVAKKLKATWKLDLSQEEKEPDYLTYEQPKEGHPLNLDYTEIEKEMASALGVPPEMLSEDKDGLKAEGPTEDFQQAHYTTKDGGKASIYLPMSLAKRRKEVKTQIFGLLYGGMQFTKAEVRANAQGLLHQFVDAGFPVPLWLDTFVNKPDEMDALGYAGTKGGVDWGNGDDQSIMQLTNIQPPLDPVTKAHVEEMAVKDALYSAFLSDLVKLWPQAYLLSEGGFKLWYAKFCDRAQYYLKHAAEFLGEDSNKTISNDELIKTWKAVEAGIDRLALIEVVIEAALANKHITSPLVVKLEAAHFNTLKAVEVGLKLLKGTANVPHFDPKKAWNEKEWKSEYLGEFTVPKETKLPKAEEFPPLKSFDVETDFGLTLQIPLKKLAITLGEPQEETIGLYSEEAVELTLKAFNTGPGVSDDLAEAAAATFDLDMLLTVLGELNQKFHDKLINVMQFGAAFNKVLPEGAPKLWPGHINDVSALQMYVEGLKKWFKEKEKENEPKEVVELTISGLSPEEAEEVLAKYVNKKGAQAPLVSKKKMKDVGTNSKGVLFWEFESSSMVANGVPVKYLTQLNEDGTLSCNCHGWTLGSAKSSGGRHCKHTRSLEEQFDTKLLYKKWKKGEPLGDQFEAVSEQEKVESVTLSKAAAPQVTFKAKRIVEI